jgi:uncharacterized DUF497 family protein
MRWSHGGSRSLNYTSSMNFEWDEGKSSACYRARGFDFAYAAFAFADPDRIIRQDHRFIYGEDRYELIGRIEGRLYVLIYTPRQDGIRIISARKANQREVKRYENRSNED